MEAKDLKDAYERSKNKGSMRKAGSLLSRKEGRIDRRSIIIIYNFANPKGNGDDSDRLVNDEDQQSFCCRNDDFTNGARAYLEDASKRGAF